MLDIKVIRDNPAYAKQRLSERQTNYDREIDKVIELDTKRRDCIYNAEQLKSEQNAANKEIPAVKKSGGDVSAIFARLKEISDKIKAYDAQVRSLDEELNTALKYIPNIPDQSVPAGRDSRDNVEIRRWGEPRIVDFEQKPHWELGEALDILDPATAGKVTGTRFHFYKGAGAALERAIVNYYLDTHTRKNGYKEIFPPYMANRASMTGTGQLPKFEDDMFHIEGTDYYLIPTAEVPVTNMHRDEILDGTKLPIKYAAYSACFRAEAGSAGRDTRGLIRQHQFNKVELVKFTLPENSFDELEKLTLDAQSVLIGLGLPHRVVLLCTGDMGFSSAKTYDIEVWMPSYNKYVEISSCSNFLDYQARRASIRYKMDKNDKTKLVHTLNGSGVAIGRTVAAIMENYQNKDGTITIPEALRGYMGGAEIIGIQ